MKRTRQGFFTICRFLVILVIFGKKQCDRLIWPAGDVLCIVDGFGIRPCHYGPIKDENYKQDLDSDIVLRKTQFQVETSSTAG